MEGELHVLERKSRGIVSIGWILPFAIGCASMPAERDLVLTVTNALSRPIATIERKACDEPEVAFAPLEDSRLSAGESRRFVLPPTCVDLVALDARRRVVGQQRGLRMQPGARWTLSR